MTISQRIFETMREKNISQLDLSKYAQIAPSTISAWKTKNSVPSSDKITLIAECLGVSVGYLLGVDSEVIQNNESPTILMNGNSFAQGYVNHNASADMFGNPDVASAYNSLSPTQKLEIQIEILKKADKNG